MEENKIDLLINNLKENSNTLSHLLCLGFTKEGNVSIQYTPISAQQLAYMSAFLSKWMDSQIVLNSEKSISTN